jgi:hypothetical protein
MNDDRSLERAARSWLEEGPSRAPDRAVDAALSRIQTTRQERDLVPWRLPNMRSATRLVAGMAAIAAVLVGAVLVAPRLGSGIGSAPSPTATAAASPTATPGATANDAACRLITSDEIRAAAGNPGLGASLGPGGQPPVTTCLYSTGGGDVILRLTYTKPGGGAAFAALGSTPGVQVVSELGDEAVFDPAAQTLYVTKSDALLAILAYPAPGAAASLTSRGIAIEMARLAAPRM